MSDPQLHAYLDGELSPDERAALEQALARDPALRARLAELRGLHGELRELYAQEARGAGPALARLRLAPEPRARRGVAWPWVVLAAAAGLVAGFFLRGGARKPARSEAPFAAVATLAT